MKLVACRGCGASIMFVRKVDGRSHPMNPAPVKFWIRADDSDAEDDSREAIYEQVTGYQSHLETCPKAVDFMQDHDPREHHAHTESRRR
jgi:hypothetical protein